METETGLLITRGVVPSLLQFFGRKPLRTKSGEYGAPLLNIGPLSARGSHMVFGQLATFYFYLSLFKVPTELVLCCAVQR